MVGHPSQRKTPPRKGQGGGAGRPADAGERVAKALARAGVASRREVERLIAEGRVALNGAVLAGPAVTVQAGDILTVDGRPVEAAEATRLFRYHKPAGLLTSHADPRGRPTVFAALPPELPRLISVGRLDLNSEGLLLLTNDGELARALELPATGWVRRYRARAFGRIDQARLDSLRAGVTVDGVRYGPIEATLDKAKEGKAGANLWITLALTEGKNREVRKVLDSLGLKVNRLIRLAYGPFALGALAPGAVEEVGPRVIREQLADLLPPASLPKGDRPLYRAPPAGAGRRPSSASPKAAQASSGPSEAGSPAAGAPRKSYKPGWARPKPPAKPAHGKGSAGAGRKRRPAADRPSRTGPSRNPKG